MQKGVPLQLQRRSIRICSRPWRDFFEGGEIDRLQKIGIETGSF